MRCEPCKAGRSAASDAFVDRKSTRLNSSHPSISYAVFCLKKKNTIEESKNVDIGTAVRAASYHKVIRVWKALVATSCRVVFLLATQGRTTTELLCVDNCGR